MGYGGASRAFPHIGALRRFLFRSRVSPLGPAYQSDRYTPTNVT